MQLEIQKLEFKLRCVQFERSHLVFYNVLPKALVYPLHYLILCIEMILIRKSLIKSLNNWEIMYFFLKRSWIFSLSLDRACISSNQTSNQGFWLNSHVCWLYDLLNSIINSVGSQKNWLSFFFFFLRNFPWCWEETHIKIGYLQCAKWVDWKLVPGDFGKEKWKITSCLEKVKIDKA